MLKRVGAVVAALVLIVVALVVRRALDDDDGGPSTPEDPGGALEVVCASEMADACEAWAAEDDDLAVTVEPAGATYDRIAAGEEPPPVWVTLAPWPDMVGAGTYPEQVTVASSPVVMVTRQERTAPLAEACGGTITWECVATNAGRPWTDLGGQSSWGSLKPGHADAARTAGGLLMFSTIVSDILGRTDYISVDLETDDALFTALRTLESAVPSFGNDVDTPLELFLRQPRFDVVGTTQAEVEQKAGQERDDLVLTAPAVQPAPRADVVVASTTAGALDDGQVQALQDALTATGWGPPDAAGAARGNRTTRSRRDDRAETAVAGSGVTMTERNRVRRVGLVLGSAGVVLAACTGGGADSADTGGGGDTPGFDADCVTVDMAVSPEKVDLADRPGRDLQRVRCRRSTASACRSASPASRPARAATLLERDWPDPEAKGPRPVIWSPASSAWGADPQPAPEPQGQDADRARGHAVHAHAARDRHAQADGRRARLPGDADRLRRHPRPGQRARGLGRVRTSRVGRRSASARPTRTSPRRACRRSSPSTTRRPARPRDLIARGPRKPEVDQFGRGVESAVVHYGDTTLTFLNNWYRTDAAARR